MKNEMNKRKFFKTSLLGALFGITAPKIINYNIDPPLIDFNKVKDPIKDMSIASYNVSGSYRITGYYNS